MADRTGDAICFPTSRLGIIAGHVTTKALWWAVALFPSLQKHRIAAGQPMTAFLPVKNNALVALQAVGPNRTILTGRAGFANGECEQ
jgi:hypothetical protein